VLCALSSVAALPAPALKRETRPTNSGRSKRQITKSYAGPIDFIRFSLGATYGGRMDPLQPLLKVVVERRAHILACKDLSRLSRKAEEVAWFLMNCVESHVPCCRH
jgi:hypothetical protein